MIRLCLDIFMQWNISSMQIILPNWGGKYSTIYCLMDLEIHKSLLCSTHNRHLKMGGLQSPSNPLLKPLELHNLH